MDELSHIAGCRRLRPACDHLWGILKQIAEPAPSETSRRFFPLSLTDPLPRCSLSSSNGWASSARLRPFPTPCGAASKPACPSSIFSAWTSVCACVSWRAASWRKEFHGAQGLRLTDEMLLGIALQACLPILNKGLDAYRSWVGVIVYPGNFVIPRHEMDEDGVVHEYDDEVLGEVWEGGPVVLSWFPGHLAPDGVNVVIHEFAHKLDMENGGADGFPRLPAGMSRGPGPRPFRPPTRRFARTSMLGATPRSILMRRRVRANSSLSPPRPSSRRQPACRRAIRTCMRSLQPSTAVTRRPARAASVTWPALAAPHRQGLSAPRPSYAQRRFT